MPAVDLRDTIGGCACVHDTRAVFPQRSAYVAKVSPNSKQGLQLPALAVAAKQRVFLWRRRAATVAVAALALVMGYGVVFGQNGLTAFAHKREEARALQQQMQRLQTENERLHEHVDHLQTDPSAIEYAAREGLHYTRQGEVIYTLPAGDPGAKKLSGNQPTAAH